MNTGNLEIARFERNELRAACAAAREAVAKLPDPEEYAYRLPIEVTYALGRCWAVPGDWRCRHEDRELLSSYGLADAREPLLSGYGMKVRKAVAVQVEIAA